MSCIGPGPAERRAMRRRRVGAVVTTIHGNKLRRFEDGWSPLEGAHWDRWTVYTDDELAANFILDPT